MSESLGFYGMAENQFLDLPVKLGPAWKAIFETSQLRSEWVLALLAVGMPDYGPGWHIVCTGRGMCRETAARDVLETLKMVGNALGMALPSRWHPNPLLPPKSRQRTRSQKGRPKKKTQKCLAGPTKKAYFRWIDQNCLVCRLDTNWDKNTKSYGPVTCPFQEALINWHHTGQKLPPQIATTLGWGERTLPSCPRRVARDDGGTD